MPLIKGEPNISKHDSSGAILYFDDPNAPTWLWKFPYGWTDEQISHAIHLGNYWYDLGVKAGKEAAKAEMRTVLGVEQ